MRMGSTHKWPLLRCSTMSRVSGCPCRELAVVVPSQTHAYFVWAWEVVPSGLEAP